jgi:integrase/recombinase XerD
MLTLYRRHRANCKSNARRAKCFCPIWVQGVLRDEPVRKSLSVTNWEAANKMIQGWEIHGMDLSVSVPDALDRWIADCEARNLSSETLRKYKRLKGSLTTRWPVSLRSVSVDDVRKLRESWTHSPGTQAKMLELLRAFFSFCEASGWVEKNPAKGVKAPQARQVPTLPYSEAEWRDILTALDVYASIHVQSPARIQRQLKALVLLMRFSGLRISDAVGLERSRIDSSGNLFIYQAKTGQPVSVPLPKVVLDALADVQEEGRFFFWNREGTLKTVTTDWSSKMRKVFLIAGLPSGHSHRLRDTFSVSLLSKGVPLQTVSILLGHKSVKTTERHYAPFVKASQDALEAAVKATW